MSQTRELKNHQDVEKVVVELVGTFRDMKSEEENVFDLGDGRTAVYGTLYSTVDSHKKIPYQLLFPGELSQSAFDAWVGYLENEGFERKPQSVYNFKLNKNNPWENGLDLLKDRLRW